MHIFGSIKTQFILLSYNILKMGICHTANIHKTETITVASLNYSGILTSPYEYY